MINRIEMEKMIRHRMEVQKAPLTDEQIKATMDEVTDVWKQIGPLFKGLPDERKLTAGFISGVLFAMSGFSRETEQWIVVTGSNPKDNGDRAQHQP